MFTNIFEEHAAMISGSTPKMEAVHFSRTSVNICQTTQPDIPEYSILIPVVLLIHPVEEFGVGVTTFCIFA
jgi:hypothetical protein